MRLHLATIVLVAACSHQTIGPDDGGGDAALVDGAIPDGSSPDGGNAKGDQGYTAGSRLQVRYYVGSDGSEQANGFYDTQRKENCYYAMADDGVIRCLPSDGVMNAFPTGYFSDANCTQPATLVYTGCTPNYITQNMAAAGCALTTKAKTAVFLPGAKQTTNQYWTKFSTTCSGPSGGYDAWTIGTQVPSTSFQDATEVVK